MCEDNQAYELTPSTAVFRQQAELDITGWALVKNVDFLLLFVSMAASDGYVLCDSD